MFEPKHASFLHRPAQGEQVNFLVYRRAFVEGNARFARVQTVQNRNYTCVIVYKVIRTRRKIEPIMYLNILLFIHIYIYQNIVNYNAGLLSVNEVT